MVFFHRASVLNRPQFAQNFRKVRDVLPVDHDALCGEDPEVNGSPAKG